MEVGACAVLLASLWVLFDLLRLLLEKQAEDAFAELRACKVSGYGVAIASNSSGNQWPLKRRA